MAEPDYDLLIIGGGINGVGIAAAASKLGLKVFLCDKGDFAGATSSASSKLIHGGLRYLENFEFSMVSQALKERQVLMQMAPHLIRPMRFILPILHRYRSNLMMRAGLFLYDRLAGKHKLGKSTRVDLAADPYLNDTIKTAFEYSDCWTDDSRLVIANALAAKENGAKLVNYTQCTQAQQQAEQWTIDLQDLISKESYTVSGRCLVNATGPWVNQFSQANLEKQPRYQIRLIKGSHIIINKRFHPEKSYLLQNNDGRVVFVIPYFDRWSLVGTTEENHEGPPDKTKISEKEQSYLIATLNNYFKQQVIHEDVISSFSGVRPLIDDKELNASKVSRDYKVSLETKKGLAPLLSIYGGKLTTYRLLAKRSLEKLERVFPIKASKNIPSTLPGGDFEYFDELCKKLSSRFPDFESSTVKRLAKNYGTLALTAFKGSSPGKHFGHGLYQIEVDYLLEHEWVKTIEDLLWRRSKLGLCFDEEQTQLLAEYIESAS